MCISHSSSALEPPEGKARAVGKTNNIIEINGKRYDARTGDVLVRHVADSPPIPIAVKVEAAPRPAAPKATKPHAVNRVPAKHLASHQPSHSKTLMRGSVKKPTSHAKHLKAHGHTDKSLTRPAAAIKPKSLAHSLNHRRLRHAGHIAKSGAVSRFRAAQPSHIIPVTVKKPASPVRHHVPPAPKPPVHHKPRGHNELLERALEQASSHTQPLHKLGRKRRLSRRKTSLAALLIAGVLLGGFVAFQNLTSTQLHIASSKAGFTASLPDSQPAGYHLSHLNAKPGEVAVHYASNTDSRGYAITEKASEWDSNALRDEFLAASGHSYQVVESGGRTLYLYGQNAATWVSGGVWYQVQSNGALSDNQLISLASSL